MGRAGVSVHRTSMNRRRRRYWRFLIIRQGPGALVQARAVTESDIWEISGDTLYFFNQYRGLQVIDVSEPDAPVASRCSGVL